MAFQKARQKLGQYVVLCFKIGTVFYGGFFNCFNMFAALKISFSYGELSYCMQNSAIMWSHGVLQDLSAQCFNNSSFIKL